MILELSVHPSRTADLVTWDRMKIDPPVPAVTYHDSFGNFCHVINAPAGRITLSSDFVINDSGLPDEVAPDAKQVPLNQLPVDTLVYLLGSRYCETDRFMELVRPFTEATRAEPGNLWFDWSKSLENDDEFILVEAFTDDGAEPHVTSEHFAQAIAHARR